MNERNKTNKETETLRELMAAYDTNRAKWIAENGTDAGFNNWFTEQVIGRN